MTRKRFVKLLMSQGITRNEANEKAKSYISNGFSYEKAYRNFLFVYGVKNGFKKLCEAFSVASVSFRTATVSIDKFKEAITK